MNPLRAVAMSDCLMAGQTYLILSAERIPTEKGLRIPTHWPSGAQKYKMGNLPHWAQFGGAICTPILGPWATDPKWAQFWGCNFCTPHFGPFWGHLSIFSVLDPWASVGQPYTNGYPTYGSQTHLRPASNPSPTLGVHTNDTQRINLTLNHIADHPSRGVNTDGARPTSSLRYLKSEYSRAGSQKFPVSTSFYMTFFTVLPNGLTTHSLHTTRIPKLWRAGHIHHRHPKPYYYCRSHIQGNLTSTVTPKG